MCSFICWCSRAGESGRNLCIDLRALGVSVCFTLFKKKIARDSLLVSALEFAKVHVFVKVDA